MTDKKLCFDRMLPNEMNRPQRTMMIGNRQRALFVFRKMWVNGSNLHVRFLEGTPRQQAIAKEQASWWTEHANLKFIFDDATDAQIRIAFDENDGAWSYIGTDASQIPLNQPTMNLGFLDGGTAAHEFGHAIGLAHEHQNPDGGIQWNEEEVIRSLSGPPNNWNEAQIRHNVLNKYDTDQIKGSEFDPHSVMLYFFPDSWVLNGKGTKANEVLSSMDKAFIASSEAYPKDAKREVVPLPVIETTGTAANIGVPGEEDLFKFAVSTPGRHVIETGGQTDVVMKLFGPGSQTALIAEDDDGGEGRNSKIAADLISGEYFLQVRHYNTSNGSGIYTIKVSR